MNDAPAQPDFFGPHALARRRDPESSHLAARKIERSGRAAAQRAKTLAAVKNWPGCTSMELAKNTGLERYMLARRLPELRKGGLIRNGEDQICAVSKVLGLTWWPQP